MDSIAERIGRIRKDKNMSHNQFSKKLGITHTTAQTYEEGGTSPRADIIEKMCDVFGVNPNWLILGTGAKYITETILYDNFTLVKFAMYLNGKWEEGTDFVPVENEYIEEMKYDNLVVTIADGHSMEPDIKNGDKVLIDKSQVDVRAGRVYAFDIDGSLLMREVDVVPSYIYLRPYNENYKTIEIKTSKAGFELKEFVLGRVLAWFHKVP